MKIYLQILLVCLLFSCATIKECNLDYLKSKYEREYNICEDILTKKVNIDSVLNDPNISDPYLVRRYREKISTFSDLYESLKSNDFKLVEIKKYKIENDIRIEIAFTIYDDFDVLCFIFYEGKNGSKLYGIQLNPGIYYKYRKPERDKPNIYKYYEF